MRILRSLFNSNDEYSPLSLMHFTPRDQHREVFVAHSIYHHLKNNHLALVSDINNSEILNDVITIAFDYGKALIEHEFPGFQAHLDASIS